jgi:hypothetical protein
LTFAVPVQLDAAVSAFNRAAPSGLRILDAMEVTEGAPRFARWLRASLWDLRYCCEEIAGLHDGVRSLAHADRLPVDRERKGTTTKLDLRPALHEIVADGDVVRVILHHTEPPFRPSEVHQLLRAAVGESLHDPQLVTRIAQGSPESGGIREALSGQFLAATTREHAAVAGQTNRGHQ